MAPAPRALASLPSSVPSWPTSADTQITSTPRCSIIHRTATDVSNPPLYASTTFFAIAVLPSLVVVLSASNCPSLPTSGSGSVEPGQISDAGLDRCTLAGCRDHQQGVIAGDGAQGVDQPRPIEGRGHHMGRARRCAEHDQVARAVELHDPFAQHTAERVFGSHLL